MRKTPFEETFDRVAKELQDSVNVAMSHLQQGIQEYLADSIDISSLLKVIEKIGLSNVMGATTIPIPGLDYYKILGLEKTATNDEVTKRYREIMAKIHPDISGQKMTFLSALVNNAYDIICKERGI